MNPNEKANEEAQDRWNQLPHGSIAPADVVVGQRCQIDAHKCDQRTEVEQLRAVVVSDEESPNQRNHAHEYYVVGGNASSGMNRSKELLRNGVAASHAVKQPRRAELRPHARTDGGNQKRDAERLSHEGATRNAGDVAEYALISKLLEDTKVPAEMLQTQQLHAVDFGGGEKYRNDADQHRRQKNIPLGI